MVANFILVRTYWREVFPNAGMTNGAGNADAGSTLLNLGQILHVGTVPLCEGETAENFEDRFGFYIFSNF